MDWSVLGSLAGLIGAGAALWAAAWAIVRERSPLRELERITSVLKETPDNAPRRRELEAVRDHLSLRLNIRYRVPPQTYLIFLSWTLIVASFIFFILFIVIASIDSRPLPLPFQITYGFLNGVLLSIGYMLLYKWQHNRMVWAEAVQASGDVTSTTRDLV
jgi:hypothetical protein